MSAHLEPLPFAEKIFARAQQKPDLISAESSYLLYVILDELVENYETLILHLEDEIEKMEDRALSDDSDRFLSDLLDLKHYTFAIGRLADQHRAVFMALLRPDFPFVLREDVVPYFRDLETHLARIVDLLMMLRELVNGSFNLFVSRVSHQTNKVMKLLTMVSTVLLPTTVILGLFGTNFTDVPMYGLPEFWLMVAGLISIPTGLLLFFRSRRWI